MPKYEPIARGLGNRRNARRERNARDELAVVAPARLPDEPEALDAHHEQVLDIPLVLPPERFVLQGRKLEELWNPLLVANDSVELARERLKAIRTL